MSAVLLIVEDCFIRSDQFFLFMMIHIMRILLPIFTGRRGQKNRIKSARDIKGGIKYFSLL